MTPNELNRLLEILARVNLSPYESRVVFCIIRHSYGEGKKSVNLTCKQIADYTSLDIRDIPRIVKRLIAKKVIGREGHTYWVTQSTQSKSIQSTQKSNINNNLHQKKKEEREQLIRELRKHLPKLTVIQNIPTKRLDFLLWKVERGEINPGLIVNPMAYLKALEIPKEDNVFPSFTERVRRRKAAEQAKLMIRLQNEQDFTPEERLENFNRLSRLSELISNLNSEEKVSFH